MSTNRIAPATAAEHPTRLVVSTLLLTVVVVLAMVFFSEFGGAVANVIYGDF